VIEGGRRSAAGGAICGRSPPLAGSPLDRFEDERRRRGPGPAVTAAAAAGPAVTDAERVARQDRYTIAFAEEPSSSTAELAEGQAALVARDNVGEPIGLSGGSDRAYGHVHEGRVAENMASADPRAAGFEPQRGRRWPATFDRPIFRRRRQHPCIDARASPGRSASRRCGFVPITNGRRSVMFPGGRFLAAGRSPYEKLCCSSRHGGGGSMIR